MSPAEKIFTSTIFNSYDINSESSMSELYSELLESIEPTFICFVKLKYFREIEKQISRYQEIPKKYFYEVLENSQNITTFKDRIFVSHKWQTKNHPDPNRENLDAFLKLTRFF
jgi:hypothetical protein